MKNMIRNGALALSVIAGTALIAAPASVATAKSIQQDGYFGGTWSAIGPKHNRHVQRHERRNFGVRAYYGPRYGYGPRYDYYGPRYGAPYYYDRGSGFSITIR